MSSPKDDTTEFIGNSDTNENHLSSDEKPLTEKGKEISITFEEDSEKYIVGEITTEKENESHGDTSVDEVISKPECQAGEPIVHSELEITNLQKNVTDEVQKQNELEHIEEKENPDSVADEHQNDTLNASALDENTSDYLESDEESLSDEFMHSYNTATMELTVGKISENVLQVFEERSLHKEMGAGSQITQVSGGSDDEQNQYFEADSQSPAVQNDTTSTEDSVKATVGNGDRNVLLDDENQDSSTGSNMPEVQNAATSTEKPEVQNAASSTKNSVEATVGNGDRNVLLDEENKDSSTGSNMPEVQNAAASSEDSVAIADESEDKDLNGFADERKKDSSAGSKTKEVQNAATRIEVSVDEDSSPNAKKLPAKHRRRSSAEVTEIISKYLNSEGYIKKLDKIDEFVKQLTSAEFLSSEFATEDFSPEDFEILKELFSEQLELEKMATKRKSKLSELDEDPEELQAISKKCKLSGMFDRPFNIQDWESSCCLEEQFRVAFKETSDDHSGNSQKAKEYRFPLATGNEQQRKFCKHQIAKIDAMVASEMYLDKYRLRIPVELDNPSNSTEEVYEDTPCCYHIKAQSSSSSRKLKDKNFSGLQKLISKKMAAYKTKWCSYFSFERALNCIANFILFVSFTGSLLVAMTVGKVFGVDFPVGKSKRNNTRDNSLLEFDFDSL